ncbi:MAG: HAD-IA family hydrolase [Pseudomonadota bacterium]|nr:HAD-IA family hydrolase [Pseudomonadota bacterium]
MKNFLIDMDGVLLDIAYDNFFWQKHVPQIYANEKGCDIDQAIKITHTLFRYKKGSRDWYDLDYWSNILGIDIVKEKKSELSVSKIKIKDGVIDVLIELKNRGMKLFLVTNAHRKTLDLKLEKYPLHKYFDEAISAHDFNYIKEDIQFWYLLRNYLNIDYNETILVEDTMTNIQSARHSKLRSLYVTHSEYKGDEWVKPIECFSKLMSCLD